MGDEGFEPATNRLRVYCSTVELVTRTNNHHSKLLTDLLVARPKNELKREFDGEGSLTGSTLYIN